MAGQVLKQGSILQAVGVKPLREWTNEEFHYNKKGLLIEKNTTKDSISLAEIIVILIGAGILVASPAIIAHMDKHNIGWDDLLMDAPFGFAGLIAGLLGDIKVTGR